MSAETTSSAFSQWQRLSWPRPEWWTLAISIGAWLLILSGAGAHPAMEHASVSHDHHVTATTASGNILTAWPVQIFWWLVMVVAMMFPLLVDHVRNTAARSLWSRRHRAIGIFLTGYATSWLIFGAFASGAYLILNMQTWSPTPVMSALGFGLAILWQGIPLRRRSLLACHRTRPIAPTGWRADRDCLRYGWMVGGSCVVSCWALMLACLLSGHSVAAMIGVTAIVLFERTRVRPNQFFACAALLALAAVTLLL